MLIMYMPMAIKKTSTTSIRPHRQGLDVRGRQGAALKDVEQPQGQGDRLENHQPQGGHEGADDGQQNEEAGRDQQTAEQGGGVGGSQVQNRSMGWSSRSLRETPIPMAFWLQL